MKRCNKIMIKKSGDDRFRGIDDLRLNMRYNLKFVDEYDDYVRENIAPKYNGVYDFIDVKILPEDDDYEETTYAVFKNKTNTVHLLNNELLDTENHGVTMFYSLLVGKVLLQFDNTDTSASHTDVYELTPCIVTTYQHDEDKLAVSIVARNNGIKYLPIDLDREVQNFITKK